MWVVAVHVGAGHHSLKNERAYRLASSLACERAGEVLKAGLGADVAVKVAIQVLEDDPITNAGYGSNLNLDGEVECDASLMASYPTWPYPAKFAGIGAVSGIKNPIVAAHILAEHDRAGGLMPGNRVFPLLLAGPGVKKAILRAPFQQDGLEDLWVEPGEMVSEKASEQYQHYCKVLDLPNPALSNQPDVLNDTVGAVCIDTNGVLASGVSSGGILLKLPGRVGEAGIFGAGCWAQHFPQSGIVCSTSGTGEIIMRMNFSRDLATKLSDPLEEDPATIFSKELQSFLNDGSLNEKYPHSNISVGSIALLNSQETNSSDNTVELLYGHTTETMGLAYMSSKSKKPKFIMSRKTYFSQPFIVSGLKV